MKKDNSGRSGNSRRSFDRYYSSLDVWAIAFGCIVGWGAFVMPGTTFLPVAGPLGTLISLVISAVIMLVIGNNYSFLMNKRPGTGGVYSYTKEAFGRDHAFLCSWFLCLSYLTIVFLNATALFIVIRTMFGSLLQSGYCYSIAGNEIYLKEVAVSAVALALVGLLFIKAKAFLQRIHTILSLILLAGTIFIAFICLPKLDLSKITSFGTMQISPFFAIFSIVLLAPWAFVGFDVIAFETAHFNFPVKRSRGIIFLSIIISAAVYIALALVSISVLPDGFSSWQEYFGSLGNLSGVPSVPTFYAARSLLGTPGTIIMGVTALSAILTGIIGAYRATTRVLSTMAQDRILTEKFSITTYSIMFIMIISIVISFLGRNALEWFVELTSFGAVIGFGYTSASAIKISHRDNDRKVLITGIIGTAVSLVFVLVQLIPGLTVLEAMGPESFLLLSLWCLIGFLFYWRTAVNTTLSEYSGISTSGIILFALLLYSAIMWFCKNLKSAKSIDEVHGMLLPYGIVLISIIFIGLIVMIYIQNKVQKHHELLERDKIHAEERGKASSQFLFNMSHDIRTPMNAIIGYTKLAKQEKDSLPAMQDYIEKIEVSGNHLLTLINDILEMSRIEAGKMELNNEPGSVPDTVESAFEMYKAPMLEKKIDYSLDMKGVSETPVFFDKTRFLRVLLNMISNACKFTPEGGKVRIVVHEKGRLPGNSIGYEIRVKDNGIGMTEEFAGKVFETFARERTSTVSKLEGTGL